jgi:hypothetical protein
MDRLNQLEQEIRINAQMRDRALYEYEASPGDLDKLDEFTGLRKSVDNLVRDFIDLVTLELRRLTLTLSNESFFGDVQLFVEIMIQSYSFLEKLVGITPYIEDEKTKLKITIIRLEQVRMIDKYESMVRCTILLLNNNARWQNNAEELQKTQYELDLLKRAGNSLPFLYES